MEDSNTAGKTGYGPALTLIRQERNRRCNRRHSFFGFEGLLSLPCNLPVPWPVLCHPVPSPVALPVFTVVGEPKHMAQAGVLHMGAPYPHAGYVLHKLARGEGLLPVCIVLPAGIGFGFGLRLLGRVRIGLGLGLGSLVLPGDVHSLVPTIHEGHL